MVNKCIVFLLKVLHFSEKFNTQQTALVYKERGRIQEN